MDENLFNHIKGLKNCLKIGQVKEGGGKQGKFCGVENFPAELSTKRVDSFPLALGP
ncbi:hypothetical protein G5V65_01280 [Rhodobacter sp. HX-7-19]|uniref:Uncharacterized protein n=1 Tax=Paragemmobacter kunshanensis TaxID=2583234 RepID=A0A6M1U6U4_9RHOB|nr:hypothetical protein [Rhodobacter kunshanensis]NGQ89511.1 hypothetical protein [Rhodobacter kunshanensis]